MNQPRHRPLSVGPIRAFEAVARHLSFSAAAEELHLTQSAVSRQIKGLEDELGAPLFNRGTRSVELTGDGQVLLRAVAPSLDRLDTAVRQIRTSRGRRRVTVNTFASFVSLWLLPRLEAFQRANPDIDIRVSATDMVVDLDDPEIDIVLRYGGDHLVPAGTPRLFGETLTPAISPWLAEQIARGQAPPLSTPADLAGHTLAEEDDNRPTAEFLSWRRWLTLHGQPGLQPRRWMYLNFTYQQVQTALAGQAIALARMALVADSLERGDLVEPFGPAGRIDAPHAYWMVVSPQSVLRPEVQRFRDWLIEQGERTNATLTNATLTAQSARSVQRLAQAAPEPVSPAPPRSRSR